MKIAILTQPLWFNYGGILQNYALQQTLKEMGHVVYTIDIQPSLRYRITPKHLISYFIRLFKRYILKDKTVKASWNPRFTNKTISYISQNTLRFVSNNIDTTEKINPSDLTIIAKKYCFDAYVVGSDQVWIPSYYPNAFIPFDKRVGIKRVFYAASAGNKSWLDDERIRNMALHYISLFNGISVREKELMCKFQKYSDLPISHVLDPTMLLDKDAYMKFVGTNNKSGSFIYTYILDKAPFKTEVINSIADSLKAPVITGTPAVFYEDIDKNNKHDAVYEPIENWLSNYYYSDYIVTDSFHGTAFALLFNKQFVVIANKERGMDRFTSLLNLFNLSHRIITSIEQLENVVAQPIEYASINTKLQELREYSIRFIRESLA